MAKTKAELEAENNALLNANAALTAAANTLTGERDTARAEVTRLNGEVATRDTTIRTISTERDTARRDCERNRGSRNRAFWGLVIAALFVVGFFVWALKAQSNASDAKTVAGNAEHALSVAENDAKIAEQAQAKAEADKVNAETAKTKAEADKADAERKLAEAEKAKKDAEDALAAFKANPPTPPQPLVATPVVPSGNGAIPNGEVKEAKILQTYKRGAVVRAIGKAGPVNGRIVQPLFEVPGEIVVSMRHDQNLQEFVGNLSFDGIPREAIPDPRRIQPIRTVMKDGVVYHQLGVVQ